MSDNLTPTTVPATGTSAPVAPTAPVTPTAPAAPSSSPAGNLTIPSSARDLLLNRMKSVNQGRASQNAPTAPTTPTAPVAPTAPTAVVPAPVTSTPTVPETPATRIVRDKTPTPAVTSETLSKGIADALLQADEQKQLNAERLAAQKRSQELADRIKSIEDPETRAELAKAEYLEKLNPQKYKNVAGKILDAQDKLSAYIETWQEQNPDQEFDAERDPVYQRLADKYTPDIDEADLDAVEQMIQEENIERKVAEKTRGYDQKLAEFTVKQEVEKISNHLMPTMAQTILGDKLSEFAKDQSKFKETYDLEYDVLNDAVSTANRAVKQWYNLNKNVESFDPKNTDHKGVIDFVDSLATEFATKAPVQNGKKFLNPLDFADLRANDPKRSLYYTWSDEDIAKAITERISNAAKAQIDQENNRIQERYKKRFGTTNTPTAPVVNPEKPESPSTNDGNPNSNFAPTGDHQVRRSARDIMLAKYNRK